MKSHKNKNDKEKFKIKDSKETWADHLNSGKVAKEKTKKGFSIKNQCTGTSPHYNDDKTLTPRPRKRSVASQMPSGQRREQKSGAEGDHNSDLQLKFKKDKQDKNLNSITKQCLKHDLANFTNSQQSVQCCCGLIQPAVYSYPVLSQPVPGVICRLHSSANHEYSLCQEEYYFDCANCCQSKARCVGNHKAPPCEHDNRRRTTDLDTENFSCPPKERNTSPEFLKAVPKSKSKTKDLLNNNKESIEKCLKSQRRECEKLRESIQKRMRESEKMETKEVKEKSCLRGENFYKLLSKSEASELVKCFDLIIDEREKELRQQNKIKKQNSKDKTSTTTYKVQDEMKISQVDSRREQKQVTTDDCKQMPTTESRTSHYSHKTIEMLKKMKIREYSPQKPTDKIKENIKLDKTKDNKQQQEKIRNFQQYLLKFSKQEKVSNREEVLRQPSANCQAKVDSEEFATSEKPDETEELKREQQSNKKTFGPKQTYQNLNLKTSKEPNTFPTPEIRHRRFPSKGEEEEDQATTSRAIGRLQKLNNDYIGIGKERQPQSEEGNDFAEQQYQLKKLKDLNNETKQDMEAEEQNQYCRERRKESILRKEDQKTHDLKTTSIDQQKFEKFLPVTKTIYKMSKESTTTEVQDHEKYLRKHERKKEYKLSQDLIDKANLINNRETAKQLNESLINGEKDNFKNGFSPQQDLYEDSFYEPEEHQRKVKKIKQGIERSLIAKPVNLIEAKEQDQYFIERHRDKTFRRDKNCNDPTISLNDQTDEEFELLTDTISEILKARSSTEDHHNGQYLRKHQRAKERNDDEECTNACKTGKQLKPKDYPFTETLRERKFKEDHVLNDQATAKNFKPDHTLRESKFKEDHVLNDQALDKDFKPVRSYPFRETLRETRLSEAHDQSPYLIEPQRQQRFREDKNYCNYQKFEYDRQSPKELNSHYDFNSHREYTHDPQAFSDSCRGRRSTEHQDQEQEPIESQKQRKFYENKYCYDLKKPLIDVQGPIIIIDCLRDRRSSGSRDHSDQTGHGGFKLAQNSISKCSREKIYNDAHNHEPYSDEILRVKNRCRAAQDSYGRNEHKYDLEKATEVKQGQYPIRERTKESQENYQKNAKEFKQVKLSTSKSPRERRLNETENHDRQKKPSFDTNNAKQLLQNTQMDNLRERIFCQSNEQSRSDKDKETLKHSPVKSDDSVNDIKMEESQSSISDIYGIFKVGDQPSKETEDYESSHLESAWKEEKEDFVDPEVNSIAKDAPVGRPKTSNETTNRYKFESSPRKFKISKEEHRSYNDGRQKGDLELQRELKKETLLISPSSGKKSKTIKDHKISHRELEKGEQGFCNNDIEKDNLEIWRELNKEALFTSAASSRRQSKTIRQHKSTTREFELEKGEQRFYYNEIQKDNSELLRELKREGLLASPTFSGEKSSAIEKPKEKRLSETKGRSDHKSNSTKFKTEKEEPRFSYANIENEDFELQKEPKEEESSKSYSAHKPLSVESQKAARLSEAKQGYDHKGSGRGKKIESENERLHYFGIARDNSEFIKPLKNKALDTNESLSRTQPSTLENRKEVRSSSDQSQTDYERFSKDFRTEKEQESSDYFGLESDDPKLLRGFKQDPLDVPRLSSRQTYFTASSREATSREEKEPCGYERFSGKSEEKAKESLRNFQPAKDVPSPDNITSLEISKQTEDEKEKLTYQKSNESRDTEVFKAGNLSFLSHNILDPIQSSSYNDFKIEMEHNFEIFNHHSKLKENNSQKELKSEISKETFTKERKSEDKIPPLSHQAQDVLRNLKKFLKSFPQTSLEENKCLHSVTKAAKDLISKLSSCKSLTADESSVKGLLEQTITSKDNLNKCFEEHTEEEALFKDPETSPESSDSQLKPAIKNEEGSTTNLQQSQENEMQFIEEKASLHLNESSKSESETLNLKQNLQTAAVNKELPTNEYFEQETYQLQILQDSKQNQTSEIYQRYKERKANLSSSTLRADLANDLNQQEELFERETSKRSSCMSRQSVFDPGLMPLKGILKPCRLVESPQADTCNVATYKIASAVSDSEKDVIGIQQRAARTYNLEEKIIEQQINNELCETVETKNTNSQQPIAIQSNFNYHKTDIIQHQQSTYPEGQLATAAKQTNGVKNTYHSHSGCGQMPAFNQCPCMWDIYVKMMNNYYKGKSKQLNNY